MPTPRKFKPGTRQKRFTQGRISENRLAWLSTYIGQFVIMRYENLEEETDADEEIETVSEPGPTIRLMLPTPRGRSIFYNLTALTHEELTLLKELFDMLFELAEPIVKERDKAAQDAYDRGDDSFTRIYRTVPRLVVRERAIGSDDQGVHERPDDLRERGGGDGAEELRGRGDGLADEAQADGRAQDDDAPDDQPQDVRQVGGLG